MDEDDLMMPFMTPKVNRRIYKKPYGFQYDVYYTEDIGNPSDYIEDFELYSNASMNDVINIHINSQGGRLDTLIQIVNHIQNTQASTLGILEGEANSAAGALFLQCSSWAVGENASLMVHEPHFGSVNSADKVYKHVDFMKRQSTSIFEKYYKYFLTEEEIVGVLEGKDFWLDQDEIYERLTTKQLKMEEEGETQKTEEE